jgi:hypothetical protein
MADPVPSSAPKFYNYPDPKEYNIPYVATPEAKNPVFRGLPLTIGASVVAAVSPIATYLYSNAGFACLRGLKELDDIECRYDPTVIPIKSAGEAGATGSLEHAIADNLRPEVAAGSADTRFYGIRDYHEAYKSGKLTPTDVVNRLLPLIRRDISPRTTHSTAFLSSRVDLITAAAEASTKRYASGTPLSVLDGVPVGVKDEVNVRGYSRTLGMAKTVNDGDVETSWCVKKWEECGAVIVGKTNMHEIGMDTTNLNTTYGTPLNPYNEGFYTGGSSGGSGYVVGSGLVPVALGLGMITPGHGVPGIEVY